MALPSPRVMLSRRSTVLWPSPTRVPVSPRLSALRFMPPLTHPSTSQARAAPPQLLEGTVNTCRRLLHRRSAGCTSPFTSPPVSGFAHRTGARLPEIPTLPAISVGLPLRCLQSFVFLRPASSPRRSDWLRVTRLPAVGVLPFWCSPFPESVLVVQAIIHHGNGASLLATLSLRIGFSRQSGYLSEMGN